MSGLVPDDLRGSATAWWRFARREVDRRRVAASHAAAVRRHERAINAARRWTARYTCAAAAALVAVPVTSGWSEVVWGVTSGAFATGAGLSAREARRRRLTPPPAAPAIPGALPGPPPLGSASWPALRRIDVACAALRRAAATTSRTGRDAVEPALTVATSVEDEARRGAARVAAAEAAVRRAGHYPHGRDPVADIAAGLADLDRAAVAIEDLLAGALALLHGAGAGAGALRAATDEARARAYGMRVAAMAGTPVAVPSAASHPTRSREDGS